MINYKLFDGEYKFMCVVWKYEPVNSTILHKLCSEELGWKKSTTYNMIKKLSEKNIVRNEKAVVTSILKKNEVKKNESELLISKVFDNSLPHFISAFLQNKKITKEEADEIRQMIEEATKTK